VIGQKSGSVVKKQRENISNSFAQGKVVT